MASSTFKIRGFRSGQNFFLGSLHFLSNKAKSLILATSFAKGQAFLFGCLDLITDNVDMLHSSDPTPSRPTKLESFSPSTGQDSCLILSRQQQGLGQLRFDS